MNKIGILTDNTPLNFDSALRSAALCQAIAKEGYEVATLRYHSMNFSAPVPSGSSFYHYIRLRLSKRRQKRNRPQEHPLWNNRLRRERFQAFSDQFTHPTPPLSSASELFTASQACDGVLTAWDTICTAESFDPHLFLDFVPQPGKRLAYAIGTSGDLSANPFKARIGQALRDLSAVAVQPEAQSDFRLLAERDIPTALDPALLLSCESLSAMASGDSLPDAPYLACYFTHPCGQHWPAALQIAGDRNLSSLTLPVHGDDLKYGDFTLSTAGPAQWIAAIQNAAYLCTDSPVAVGLALCFGIPFTAFVKDSDIKNRSRMNHLLTVTGLQRIPASASTFHCDCTEKLQSAAKALANLRQSARSDLKSMIDGAIKTPRENFQVTPTCCGCGACAGICPKGAIAIVSDASGFKVAQIDPEKCIRCGKCQSVCPFHAPDTRPLFESEGLYAFRADAPVLSTASSGGFSHALGEFMAEQDYAMIGCIYDSTHRRALHRIAGAENAELRKTFQGSKYIQSDMTEVYAAIDSGLERALFVGTPCQVSAVARRLGQRRENWVLCELICHGVSSDWVWTKYLDYLNDAYHVGAAPQVLFRDKRYGWKPSHHITIEGNQHHYDSVSYEDPFYQTFLSHVAMRSSCFECVYRQSTCADLRIGDYWGKRFSSDKKGVSMVVACSPKGQAIIDDMIHQNCGHFTAYPLSDYQEKQLTGNVPVPAERDEVLRAFANPGISMSEIQRRYLAPRYMNKKYKAAWARLRKRIFRH